MEIWLDTMNALTIPKWTKGYLRDQIDPSSAFWGILHVTTTEVESGSQHSTPLESMVEDRRPTFQSVIEAWRDTSEMGSPEFRNEIVAGLQTTNGLLNLLMCTVRNGCPAFTPVVHRLLELIKDKETLDGEFKEILLLIPDWTRWALDHMYFIDHFVL